MPKRRSLRSRYIRRMQIGAALILLLAIPAAIHSKAAIDSLLNVPPDWVPDSLPEKAEFNELSRRFSVADVLLVSWPEAKLGSESLVSASMALKTLCQPTKDDAESEGGSQVDSESVTIEDLNDSVQEVVRDVLGECGGEPPLLWAQSGEDTLDTMTRSLSRRASIARLRGFLIGPDGEQTCLVLSLSEIGTKHRRRLIPGIRRIVGAAADVTEKSVAIVGGPRDGADVDAASIQSVNQFAPPSAILAAIICWFCLRSIPLTAAICSVAVVGEGLVLALVYYTGTPMNAVLIALPPLIFVLTVSAGIHLSNYFLDAWEEFPEMSPAMATRRAVKAGLTPCFLASGTTVVGLGSLMLVRIEPIRVFGMVASLGVIGTLLLLLLVLPGAMVLAKESSEKRQKRRETGEGGDSSEPTSTESNVLTSSQPPSDQTASLEPKTGWRRWFYQNTRQRLTRPWPVILVFLVITTVLAGGLFRLRTSVNLLRMFRPESSIRAEYAWFEEAVGPTSSADLLLRFSPLQDDDDPLERLKLLGRAHISAVKLDSVGGALSAMTFMKSIPSGRSLSASSRRAAIAKVLRDPNSNLSKTNLISRDPSGDVWRISLRLWKKEQTDYTKELAEIKSHIQSELSESEIPVKIQLTGPVAIVDAAQAVLLKDLFRSFLTAFLIVAVVMVFVLRSLIGGVIAMIPNLFPTVALFGWMGLNQTALDIGSVMTASVALGIAVDDTIHLLSRFGSRRKRGFGQIRAAHGALSQCGWAMFQTTMVCGLSLMAYYFSDFVPTSQFAVLMFGLLSAALICDVFLLPALMASPLGKYLAHTVGADPAAELSLEKPMDTRRI